MNTTTQNSSMSNLETLNLTNPKTVEFEIPKTHKCTKCETTFSGDYKLCLGCRLRQQIYVQLKSVNGDTTKFTPEQLLEYSTLLTEFEGATGRAYKPRFTATPEPPTTKPSPKPIIRSISTNLQTNTLLLKSSTDITIASITASGNIELYAPDLFTLDGIPATELYAAYNQLQSIKEAIK